MFRQFGLHLRSKHHAALFLHYALEQNPQKDFRFMWNFSSTSVYGNMGQLNYSGSNSFLDVLTRHRKVPQIRMHSTGLETSMSIHLFIHLFIHVFIHLFIHLFIAATMSRAPSLHANFLLQSELLRTANTEGCAFLSQ